ncbi:ATP-grasp domain-containing protein [Actinacidiphila alni]|uniref:ATP-grasp domain-containing protein n=1 Tax=Actinacidiphila alni TaxID=380248 RepID=UPI000B85E4E1|nr:ATP-grasp domain-containing protein [Actinacidiphila alni]
MLLVVGAGVGAYRAYGLKSMSAVAPLVLIDADPPSWTRRHTVARVRADPADPAELFAAALEVTQLHPVGGVTTYIEEYVTHAAFLAEALGLPGPSPEAAGICRDKHATRVALDRSGVGSARSELVRGQDQAVGAADRIGYPVVVKPRRLAGSVGVRLCTSPDQVRDAYHAAASARLLEMRADGVLVEGYLDGPEVSAECVVTADGTCHVVAVARKALGPHPGFEETGHTVDSSDELLADEALLSAVRGAVTATGYRSGVVHVELRIVRGQPAVIEINARPAGDLIPHLVHLATGVDLAGAAADVAFGRDPQLTPTRGQAAGVRFLYPGRPGVLDRRLFTHCGAPWLDRQIWTAVPGDPVTPPPEGGVTDRLGHLVVTGPTPLECRRRLDEVEAATSIAIRPAPAGSACVQ